MKYKTFTMRYHQKSEIIAVYYNEFQILQKIPQEILFVLFVLVWNVQLKKTRALHFYMKNQLTQKGQRKNKSRGEKIWVIFSAMLLGFPSLMQKLICKLNLSVTSMSLPKFIGEELEVKNCLTSHTEQKFWEEMQRRVVVVIIIIITVL